MKLTIRDLRSLIRESLEDLDERAMTSADAGDDLAMYLNQQANKIDLALYRLQPMQQDFEAGFSPKTLQKHIVAAISVIQSDFKNPYFEVMMVAADKGWGPFMYDAAMSLAGGLMPDRFSVSGPALRVWQVYDQRSDVAKESLKKYGIRTHGERVLDQGYKLKGPGPNIDALVQRHDDDLSSNVWDSALKYSVGAMNR